MIRGQAMVVVLLVLGVALTVGMSIVSRSITEVSVSTTQDESSEALSAAEAGIEKALGGVVPGPTGTSPAQIQQNVGNGSFNLTAVNQSASSDFVFGDTLESGDVGTISLGTGNAGNTFTVCLGQSGPLEIMGYYRIGATVAVARNYVAAPGGASGCPSGPAFVSSTLVGSSFFPGGSTPLMLRVRPLGGPVAVGVRASGTMPAQGQTITSTGQVGATTQKIQVTKLIPDLPPMFDHALFSGLGLTQ